MNTPRNINNTKRKTLKPKEKKTTTFNFFTQIEILFLDVFTLVYRLSNEIYKYPQFSCEFGDLSDEC